MVSREEAKKQLQTIGVESPADDQVTAYLNNVNAEAVKEKEKADKLKEKADKADEYKTQLDDLQSQNLSDAEKLQKQIDELQQQNADLTANGFRSEAKAILKGAGIDDKDIEALLPGMVADTVENTQARANAYVSAMNKFRDNAIKEREKADLDGTKTPGADGDNGDETKTEAEKFAETMVKESASEAKGADDIIGAYK